MSARFEPHTVIYWTEPVRGWWRVRALIVEGNEPVAEGYTQVCQHRGEAEMLAEALSAHRFGYRTEEEALAAAKNLIASLL
ncbi:MAG: hypothetical protein HYV08_06995 [Deltaproteobacteria bacterium]|nr:hypothetical protein [Deltaproteobacteria bacterium]